MAQAIEFTKPAQFQSQNGLERIYMTRPPKVASATIGTLNAELVLDVSGEECAMLYIQSTAFIGTLEFTASVDGINFFPVPAYPFSPACVGGTIPIAAQPMLLDALVSANTSRAYTLPNGQLRLIRVRCSAYTSGSCVATFHADGNDSANQSMVAKPSTLLVTVTAAVGVAATATLPAVTGLRHTVDYIRVTRSATAALTASATPVLITTTNLPGNPVITMGQDVAGIGVDKEGVLDFGSSGFTATAAGAATTVVCPAYVGVIWRINVGYRLGV